MLTNEQLMHFSRQILLPEWGDDAQQQLMGKHVLIIGMGGLGCTAATILARAGLGQMTICDHDRIDASNLARQVLYFPADVGCYKIETATEKLQAMSPWLVIHGIKEPMDRQAVIALLQQTPIDLVVDCSDNFQTRDAINQACMAQRVPLLSAAAIGLDGQLALYHPTWGCFCCVFGQQASQQTPSCAQSGVLGSVPQLIASLAAHHALLYLGLGQAPLAGKVLLWDGVLMQQKLLEYVQDPQCVCCGQQGFDE